MSFLRKASLFIITFLVIAFPIWCAEILVDPSFIKIQNVPLGTEVELAGIENCFLKIINQDNRAGRYKVLLLSCKEYGREPNPGYTDIPDKNYFSMKSSEVVVLASQTGYIKGFSIKIPKKMKYYNQRWQTIVKVKKEANPGEAINLEVILPLWIETQRKKFSLIEKLFQIFIK